METIDELENLWNDQMKSSILSIRSYMTSSSEDTRKIVNWIIENYDYAPFHIDGSYVRFFATPYQLSGLFQIIHHAIVDDGDINFIKVGDKPFIIFADRFVDLETLDVYPYVYKMLKNKGHTLTTVFLNNFDEFVHAYNEYRIIYK